MWHFSPRMAVSMCMSSHLGQPCLCVWVLTSHGRVYVYEFSPRTALSMWMSSSWKASKSGCFVSTMLARKWTKVIFPSWALVFCNYNGNVFHLKLVYRPNRASTFCWHHEGKHDLRTNSSHFSKREPKVILYQGWEWPLWKKSDTRARSLKICTLYNFTFKFETFGTNAAQFGLKKKLKFRLLAEDSHPCYTRQKNLSQTQWNIRKTNSMIRLY
jgi:hypothetical protein